MISTIRLPNDKLLDCVTHKADVMFLEALPSSESLATVILIVQINQHMRFDSLKYHVKSSFIDRQRQLTQQPSPGAADGMLHLTKEICRLDSAAIVECF